MEKGSQRINQAICSDWKEKCQTMKKMRHVKDDLYYGQKEYLKTSSNIDSRREAADYLWMRLEMFDIGNNHGKNRKCVCGEPEELEHIVECERVRERIQWEEKINKD
eukprot:TCONS_00035772-protein